MAKTSASFTLMDYTDGISLITGIDSNLPLTSLYDTTTQTLNPSWAGSTSLQLTPKVLKAGSAVDLVESMTTRKWYRRLAGASSFTEVVSGQNGETINATTGVLSVSEDKLVGNVWQIDYKFTGTYTDPVLGLDFPLEIKITLSRVANGTSLVVPRAYAPGGTEFKNNLPATLTVVSELLRGSARDITNLTYQWQKSTNGTTWTDLSSTGYNTSTLTVTSTMVDSFAMFRCIITDTDSSSETYNQSFTTEGVSFTDISDPYQAVIMSTAGSYFKNETGSTILVCKVYRSGTEIDTTGGTLTYVWTKTDKDGNPVVFTPTYVAYGDIAANTHKAISVSHDDVTIKATYFCEVS